MMYPRQQHQIPRHNQDLLQYSTVIEGAPTNATPDLPYVINAPYQSSGINHGFQNVPNKEEAINIYNQNLQNLQQRILE